MGSPYRESAFPKLKHKEHVISHNVVRYLAGHSQESFMHCDKLLQANMMSKVIMIPCSNFEHRVAHHSSVLGFGWCLKSWKKQNWK